MRLIGRTAALHVAFWQYDPWYRRAWFVWPQTAAILLAVWLIGDRMAQPIGNSAKSGPGDQETCQMRIGDVAIEACTRRIFSGELKGQPLAAAYRMRGTAVARKNEYDRAIADFDEAIRLDPKDGAAFSARGAMYSIKGEYDRAIADSNAAISLTPNGTTYSNRGFVYNNRGEYDRAIMDLDRAIRLNPKSGFAYKNRGISYEKKSEFQKALNDYNQAIGLDSNLQEAIEGAKRVNEALTSKSPPGKVGQAQQVAAPSGAPRRIVGADLFIDIDLYWHRPVVLTDGRVFGATNQYALITTGGATFSISVEGIDRESFRFFLSNCSGIVANSHCKMPLLVTPTGQKLGGNPVVKDVKIVQ